jgi:hypothetical protein
MSTTCLAKYAITGSLSIALLAACSSAGSTRSAIIGSLSPQAAGGFANNLAIQPIGAVHPDHRASWFSPNKKKSEGELWISDEETQVVYILSLPSLSTIAMLTGFNYPQGMCTAKNGDVWIANTGTQQVLEYTRAGKKVASLTDSIGNPVSCAVDAANDLAVTNITGASGGGQVLLYKNSSGTPTELSNPSQSEYFLDGFDPKGNLFVDGLTSGNTFILSECAAGSTSCSTITINGATLYWPGFVEWNPAKKANDLVVGDQFCGEDPNVACAYSMTISGSAGTVTNTTPFENSLGVHCDMVQGVINSKGDRVSGGEIVNGCYYGPSEVDTWNFPAGGTPNAYATKVSYPVGAALTK